MKKTGYKPPTREDLKNDIPQRIGWDYYDSMKTWSERSKYIAKTQHYTPIEIVNFLVNSSVPLAYKTFKEKNGDDKDFRLLDPTCGAGIFLLIALRHLSKLMTISKKEIVENCIIGIDTDIGAVNAAKKSLRAEVGSNCKTKILWGDCLSEFFLECTHMEDVTNLDLVDDYNRLFDEMNVSYMAACNKQKRHPSNKKGWTGFIVYTNWDKEGVFDNSRYHGGLDAYNVNLQSTSSKPKLDAYLVS